MLGRREIILPNNLLTRRKISARKRTSLSLDRQYYPRVSPVRLNRRQRHSLRTTYLTKQLQPRWGQPRNDRRASTLLHWMSSGRFSSHMGHLHTNCRGGGPKVAQVASPFTKLRPTPIGSFRASIQRSPALLTSGHVICSYYVTSHCVLLFSGFVFYTCLSEHR